jgi:hypothetical protein
MIIEEVILCCLQILHGSAAFHDGRFHENDRLIGIENHDLREYKHNADALAAFTNTLGNVPLEQKSVKIHIARCKDYPSIDFGRKVSSINNKEIHPFKATSSNVDGYESEVSLAPDSDAFNRKNPIRKSISEKHPFGGGKDAIHAQAYQKILHQRQTSGRFFSAHFFKNVFLFFCFHCLFSILLLCLFFPFSFVKFFVFILL